MLPFLRQREVRLRVPRCEVRHMEQEVKRRRRCALSMAQLETARKDAVLQRLAGLANAGNSGAGQGGGEHMALSSSHAGLVSAETGSLQAAVVLGFSKDGTLLIGYEVLHHHEHDAVHAGASPHDFGARKFAFYLVIWRVEEAGKQTRVRNVLRVPIIRVPVYADWVLDNAELHVHEASEGLLVCRAIPSVPGLASTGSVCNVYISVVPVPTGRFFSPSSPLLAVAPLHFEVRSLAAEAHEVVVVAQSDRDDTLDLLLNLGTAFSLYSLQCHRGSTSSTNGAKEGQEEGGQDEGKGKENKVVVDVFAFDEGDEQQQQHDHGQELTPRNKNRNQNKNQRKGKPKGQPPQVDHHAQGEHGLAGAAAAAEVVDLDGTPPGGLPPQDAAQAEGEVHGGGCYRWERTPGPWLRRHQHDDGQRGAGEALYCSMRRRWTFQAEAALLQAVPVSKLADYECRVVLYPGRAWSVVLGVAWVPATPAARDAAPVLYMHLDELDPGTGALCGSVRARIKSKDAQRVSQPPCVRDMFPGWAAHLNATLHRAVENGNPFWKAVQPMLPHHISNTSIFTGESLPHLVHPVLPLVIVGWGAGTT